MQLQNVENLSSCLLLQQSRGFRSVVCSSSALCKVIYWCPVCNIRSLAEQIRTEWIFFFFFFCLGTNKINSPNKMNLNFCRVVLLDVASLYFSLCVYILLHIYIRLYKSCSNFYQLGKRDFPKFIHLFFFFPSPTELLQITALPPDLEIGSCLLFFWAVTCRGFISGGWKSTHAFLLHMCFTSLALPLKSNTEMHLENFTVEMQTTTFVVSSILRLK